MKPPFERLVDEHAATVLRVCRAILGPHDAEDAWSETFLSALRAYPDLPESANVEAWLVTIAHRRSVDRVRAERSRGDRENSFAHASYQRPHDVVAETTEQREDSGAVVDCLDTLSDPQRDALTMAYYGGHTYREVSERLDAPLATVKSRIRDGLVRLRRCLEPLGVLS